MSDAPSRSPDEFVKRAPTVANTAAVGSAGSSAALLAYYIQECLTANHFVIPSTEMIIVVIGAALPMIHLIFKVIKSKIDKWAAAQGVQP